MIHSQKHIVYEVYGSKISYQRPEEVCDYTCYSPKTISWRRMCSNGIVFALVMPLAMIFSTHLLKTNPFNFLLWLYMQCVTTEVVKRYTKKIHSMTSKFNLYPTFQNYIVRLNIYLYVLVWVRIPTVATIYIYIKHKLGKIINDNKIYKK